MSTRYIENLKILTSSLGRTPDTRSPSGLCNENEKRRASNVRERPSDRHALGHFKSSVVTGRRVKTVCQSHFFLSYFLRSSADSLVVEVSSADAYACTYLVPSSTENTSEDMSGHYYKVRGRRQSIGFVKQDMLHE